MALVPVNAIGAVFDRLAHFQNYYITLQEKYEITSIAMLLSYSTRILSLLHLVIPL